MFSAKSSVKTPKGREKIPAQPIARKGIDGKCRLTYLDVEPFLSGNRPLRNASIHDVGGVPDGIISLGKRTNLGAYPFVERSQIQES